MGTGEVMTCQRPGCSNEVAPRVNAMGPRPRFCEDQECRRLRNNAASLLHYNRAAGKAPKFKAKGIRKGKRHGIPEGREIAESVTREVRESVTTARLQKTAPKPSAEGSKPASSPAHAVIPKEKKVVDGKVSLVDRQAKLAGIDRGTRDGFRRYMEARPAYFEWVFPRMTIAEAWGQIHGQ